MRVGGADRAVEVVVGPIEEEQEPTAIDTGVVGELVEEFVQHREAARQLRERFAQFLGGGPDLVDDGQDLARERPDLVLEDRRGLDASSPARLPPRGRVALANGCSSFSVGPSTFAAVASLPRPCLALPSAPGSRRSVLSTLCSSLANVLKTALEDSTSSAQLLVLAAERFDQQPEVVDRAARCSAWRTSSCEPISCRSRAVGSKRLSAADSGFSVALQPFARAGQQLLQVGARFRVQRPRGIRRSRCSGRSATAAASRRLTARRSRASPG